MSRRTVSLLVIVAVLLLLLLLAPEVPLLVFAGALFALFLRAGGDVLAARLHVGGGWGVALFAVLLLLGGGALGWIAVPTVADQAAELAQRIPEAARTLADRLDRYEVLRSALDQVPPAGLLGTGGSAATSAVTATFGILGHGVVILFVGAYLAADPAVYRRGADALVAPSVRPRARRVVAVAGDTLRRWLVAQLLSMSVVGVLTGLGLWLIGVPLAPILGLIAGLLAFIPNIGPVLSAIPGVLLGLSESPATALWAVGVYVGVQALESYLITPRIQEEAVALPPALTISVQLLFAILFGTLGLALATPVAALGLTLVRLLYVEDYLERGGRDGEGTAALREAG